MRIASIGVMTFTFATLATPAGAASPVEQPLLRDIATAPDAAQLKITIDALVGFGTRHTLSDTASPKRGIGAARRWAQARFEQIGRDCGGCLSVVTPSQTVTGARVPKPASIVDVVAIQRGTTDPERVIVLTGHIDSRVTDVMNVTADAPGADDDASGVAAVIEAARILSRYKFPATLVYGVLSGEEQGLYGGKVLADYAKEQGWRVEADLNNDIVGATRGQNGVVNNTRLRLFSEGTRDTESAEEAKQRRFEGGENDSASRNVARFAKAVAEHYMPNWTVALVYRLDRFGRGGDHSAFNALGFPAVRFTENAEDYRHQHQDLRTEGGVQYGDLPANVDFGYLAKVTATNALTAAAMASAPPPPMNVKVAGAVTPDTVLSWSASPGVPAAGYRVHWRDTTEAAWTHALDAGSGNSLTLANVAIDDFAFGVASVSADGFESPVVFPGAAGAFLAGH
ncbi:MAG TPA: M20/M25/M40 family metallo-hydrolase [Steroidobacteraceae bacterium]|jgi:Zn-dependent M28 family amino/carboxypeptidase|nr:M20/M25/M40 family metallo-hydrolase [Steroidobacteraceae bacterium]